MYKHIEMKNDKIKRIFYDTELSQSRDNFVVKFNTMAEPECWILQQYYPETDIIWNHILVHILVSHTLQ